MPVDVPRLDALENARRLLRKFTRDLATPRFIPRTDEPLRSGRGPMLDRAERVAFAFCQDLRFGTNSSGNASEAPENYDHT